jgi:hypothetical protein
VINGAPPHIIVHTVACSLVVMDSLLCVPSRTYFPVSRALEFAFRTVAAGLLLYSIFDIFVLYAALYVALCGFMPQLQLASVRKGAFSVSIPPRSSRCVRAALRRLLLFRYRVKNVLGFIVKQSFYDELFTSLSSTGMTAITSDKCINRFGMPCICICTTEQ